MTIRGIKSFGESNQNADQYIMELLRDGGKQFGEIQTHLKNNRSNYSRKGVALRLEHLIKIGNLYKVKGKQGHNTYFLSEKGKKNIEFQAKIFSHSLEGLLRAYLPPFGKKESFTEDYLIDVLIKRVGIFVLYSFFHSLRLASQKPDSEKTTIMSNWLNNSFSFKSVDSFLMDKKDTFLKFKSDEEAFEYYFYSTKKQDEIQRLENIFKKKFPSEYEFCEHTIQSQSYFVKSQLVQDEWTKTIDQYMKRIHRKHNEHKNLKPEECPRCDREHRKKPFPVNLLDIRKKYFKRN